MTGMQEHPGTGRTLAHAQTGKVVFEDLARSLGIRNVHVIDPTQDLGKFQELIQSCLDKAELSVVIARRDCLLATRAIREYERCNEQPTD
jgi:indolepyruvate ferredoxin oxidoreductase alpha subunit